MNSYQLKSQNENPKFLYTWKIINVLSTHVSILLVEQKNIKKYKKKTKKYK